MYKGKKEEEDEEIAPFAKNLQKDKGKAPQQSPEENKPSDKTEESGRSPFVISLKPSKPLVILTKAKKARQKSGDKFLVYFVSIMSSQADSQQGQFALPPMETPANIEDPASAFFIVPELQQKKSQSSSTDRKLLH